MTVFPTDFGAAARVYWTLKSGLEVARNFLNGGFRAYQKDGFELASGETKVSPVNTTRVDPAWYADTAVQSESLETVTHDSSTHDWMISMLEPHGMTRRHVQAFFRAQNNLLLRHFLIRTHLFSSTLTKLMRL